MNLLKQLETEQMKALRGGRPHPDFRPGDTLKVSVKVVDVHTQMMRGKEKRVGKFMGMRSNWKKAIVTLAPGNKIEFFEGV